MNKKKIEHYKEVLVRRKRCKEMYTGAKSTIGAQRVFNEIMEREEYELFD